MKENASVPYRLMSQRYCGWCEQCTAGVFRFRSIRRGAEGWVPLPTRERRGVLPRNLGGTAEVLRPIWDRGFFYLYFKKCRFYGGRI